MKNIGKPENLSSPFGNKRVLALKQQNVFWEML